MPDHYADLYVALDGEHHRWSVLEVAVTVLAIAATISAVVVGLAGQVSHAGIPVEASPTTPVTSPLHP